MKIRRFGLCWNTKEGKKKEDIPGIRRAQTHRETNSSRIQHAEINRVQSYNYADHRLQPYVAAQRVLTVEQTRSVERAADKLGGDESSDYFNQASEYNGKTGGYLRYYRELPTSFVKSSEVVQLLDAFANKFCIPDGQMSLIQIRTSVIGKEDEGKCLTGQGIHTMLAVLRRENVAGARSAVFADPAGKNILFGPQPLREGEVMYWQDNVVYHYVEPALRVDNTKKGYRTVLIAHYPATHYISGLGNPNNTLPPSGNHPPYMLNWN